jgi:hypothetical protein
MPQSAATERPEQEAPSETVGSAADSLDLLETPEEEAAGDALAQVSIFYLSTNLICAITNL